MSGDLARDQVWPISKQQQLARAGSGIGMPKKGNKLEQGRSFRKVASATELAEIRAEKLGPCLVCMYLGVRQEYASTLHHVVPRDRGGDDVADNMVSACGHGTVGHHGGIEAHDTETCRLFAAALQQFDPDAYVYALEHLGEDGFLRLYHVEFERP